MDYLTIKEFFELSGRSERHIRRLCCNGSIESTEQINNSNGRKSYIIPISALSEDLQAKYYRRKQTEAGILPEKIESAAEKKTYLKYGSKGVKMPFERFSQAEREEIAAEEITAILCDELKAPENIEKLVSTGIRLLAEIISGLCQIGGKLAGFVCTFANEVDSAIGEIDWAAIGISIVEGICSGLLDCDFVLSDYLGDFKDNWMTGVKDMFGIHSPSKLMKDDVGKYLALGIGEGFGENASEIGQKILNAVSGWTSMLPGQTQEAAQQFLNNTSSLFSALPSTVSEWLDNTLKITLKWNENLSEPAKNTAEKFVDNIQDYLKKLPETALKILNDSFNRFTEWGNRLVRQGEKSAAELVSKIVSGVSSLPSKMADTGKNLVEGLWNGIAGAENWLKDRIEEFSNDIIENFRNELGIHSPSAVMRDSVGKYLAQGIGVGFTEEMPDIAKDALKVFEQLEIPEISAPEIALNILEDVPEIEFSFSEVPDFEILSDEISLAEIENPELEIDVPEIEIPDTEIEISVAEIELPELELSVPEIEIPDLKIQAETPEIRLENPVPQFDDSALQALKSQELNINSGIIQTSATSEIVNNTYSYSMVNNSGTGGNPQNITINAQLVIDRETVAEGVADIITDEIDERQGIKIQLRKRGLAR